MRPGRKHGTKKFLGVIMAVGVIAAGTYAFTNTNTVPLSDAGQGANTISGYTVSDVKYTENALNPHKLASVTFTLAPKDGGGAPTTVKASLKNGADDATTGASTQTFYACSLETGTTLVLNDWTCSTGADALTQLEMSAADELDIVAHD